MKKALIICFLFFVLQQLFATAALALSMALGGTTDMAAVQTSSQFAWIFGCSYLMLYPLMLFIVHFLMANSGRSGLSGQWERPRPVAVVLSLAILLAIIIWLGNVLEYLSLPDLIEGQLGAMVKNPLCILILSVLGPVTEEICFRYGVMGSLLESARWRRWAIPVSALLFGVIHMNPPQIIAAFVLGLFLGWLYLRTRSLWLPIICHVVNNTNGTVITLLFGVESSNADLFPTPWAMAVATVVSIGLTLWLLGRLRRVLPVAGE